MIVGSGSLDDPVAREVAIVEIIVPRTPLGSGERSRAVIVGLMLAMLAPRRVTDA
jgi:hypothetical protein